MRIVVVTYTLVLGLAACASNPEVGDSGNAYVISREEVAPLSSMTAVDAIRSLRPNWFRSRGPEDVSQRVVGDYAPEPTFYVDDVRDGNLIGVCANQIQRAEFRPPSDPRIGSPSPWGIIVVRLIPGARSAQLC